MILETDTGVLLSDDDVIRYSFGIGAFPWVSFGSLTLSEKELAFKPHALLWAPSLARIQINDVVSARANPGRSRLRRRLMWILTAAMTPLTGVLGLPWLVTFWRRAGNSTLEISVRRWLFGRTRVYIIRNPEEWVERIDRLIAGRSEA